MNARPSDTPSGPDVRGFAKLIGKAKKQAIADLPLLVFLDVNVPWSPEAKGLDKQWIQDLREAIPSAPTAQKPDEFTALFATNFAGHYGLPQERQITSEWVTILSRHPRVPLHPSLLLRIHETVERYSNIPRDV